MMLINSFALTQLAYLFSLYIYIYIYIYIPFLSTCMRINLNMVLLKSVFFVCTQIDSRHLIV